MNEQMEYTTAEEERAARHAERMARRQERQRKRRREMLKRVGFVAGIAAALGLCVGLGALALRSYHESEAEKEKAALSAQADGTEAQYQPPQPLLPPEPEVEPPFGLSVSDRTVTMGEELSSGHAIVIDLTGEEILAQKDAFTAVSPASMTKILTLLVAAEAVTEADLDDRVMIDMEITDYCFVNECSVAGFLKDEAVPVRHLFYGTILPSGADAALALARYTAGSHEAFVEMMNEKAAELGLSETAHFTNCVGLYNKENVCSVYDIAMILKAAMENDLCREVLTTKIYEIAPNAAHPEGMILSNWFLRRIEDYVPDGMSVIGAKTGYVSQAGSCAASIAQTDEGAYFICVTADTTSSKQCIQDHVQLYTTYMGF